MNTPFTRFSPRAILATGLLFAVAAAQAASGVAITESREALVKQGMSAAEVEQAVGRPAEKARFLNEPGPLWTYNVTGGVYPMAVFEVDFGADGKVASVIERERMIR